MTDIPTEPRWDRYGKILYLGQVRDPKTRKIWIVIRRHGVKKAYAATPDEWLGFAAEPIGRHATSNPDERRLGVFGVS